MVLKIYSESSSNLKERYFTQDSLSQSSRVISPKGKHFSRIEYTRRALQRFDKIRKNSTSLSNSQEREEKKSITKNLEKNCSLDLSLDNRKKERFSERPEKLIILPKIIKKHQEIQKSIFANPEAKIKDKIIL